MTTPLAIHVDDLHISLRLANALERVSLTSLADIANMDRVHFAALKNVGRHTVAELEAVLIDHGFLARTPKRLTREYLERRRAGCGARYWPGVEKPCDNCRKIEVRASVRRSRDHYMIMLGRTVGMLGRATADQRTHALEKLSALDLERLHDALQNELED